MEKFKLFVFDLDDVLFPEFSYVISGFMAVSCFLSDNLAEQKKLQEKMLNLFHSDPSNVFNKLANELDDYPNKTQITDLMISTYRNHFPKISPYCDVFPILTKIHKKNFNSAILTDGETPRQKMKINSLKLNEQIKQIVYTDSLGNNKKFWKPHPHGFQILLDIFDVDPSEACYIGDNILKDFQAPNKLGMCSILISRKDGIYAKKNKSTNISPDNKPQKKISSLLELENFF